MKVYVLLVALALTSCASNQNLKESKSCHVWEKQPLFGPRSVEVTDNQSYWKGNCRLFFVFWCDWIKADMTEGETGIYLEGNGIFNDRKMVSTLKDETMTYEPTFLDGLVKSSPFSIDKSNHRIKRTVTALGRVTSEEEFEFNESCTTKQVAVGAVALVALKNRK